MRKIIIRFVLIQFILLLTGYSHQYANAGQDCSRSAVILKNSMDTIHGAAGNIRSIASISQMTFNFEIAEIEDDKFLSFKGYLKGVHFFTTLFPDQTPGHFFGYIHEVELITKPFSELTADTSFITFQVFRI